MGLVNNNSCSIRIIIGLRNDYSSCQGALGPDEMWLLDTTKTIDKLWLRALKKHPWYSELLLLDYGFGGRDCAIACTAHSDHNTFLIL